jgi:hypothetical protein
MGNHSSDNRISARIGDKMITQILEFGAAGLALGILAGFLWRRGMRKREAARRLEAVKAELGVNQPNQANQAEGKL